jgi:hypothetical protein
MAAGMSLAERQAARKRLRDEAIARAERLGMTLRCQMLADDMDNPGHQLCQGESRGGAGCLCRCHDNPGAAIVSSHDERVS